MKVPFLDLASQYRAHKDELDAAVRGVIERSAFILGPEVDAFEQEFAAYVGAKHCIGVANGTAALELIFLGLGLGSGDEIITQPNTFFATAEAISRVGARPVFVDIESADGRGRPTLDPAKLEKAISSRTKAVVPVHLCGHPADIEPIADLCERKGLILVEDACQAHGARITLKNGITKSCGALGRAAAFSFYPGKNLGAWGEGGAITTDDAELDAELRMLRDHGAPRKFDHRRIGTNSRLEGIQGAVLRVKLRHLEAWTDQRRRVAARYRELLGGLAATEKIDLPHEAPGVRHVYHVFALGVDARDDVAAKLNAAGVATGIHYPVPVHLQPAYASEGHQRGSFPLSERYAGRTLSLPMFPELTDEQIARVAEVVHDAVK
jgi:dTDP-4-amino-4,6-dideoxygalactose transaminase